MAVAPYGSWKSPITSNLIVSETLRLSQIALTGNDSYWLEMRPSEHGRSVVVHRAADGSVADVTPPEFSVRSRVHEYGGGAFAVENGTIYFCNDDDQRIYAHTPGAAAIPITPDNAYRFADIVVDDSRHRLLCIREDHTVSGREEENCLVAININDGEQEVLVAGNDFYASPALSPDRNRLAWLSWNHPNMPWDGTELWLADIDAQGWLQNKQKVAGGAAESIFQPQWSPAGELFFVSDRTGWWNLYKCADGQIVPVLIREAEVGLPQWVFGMSTYGFGSEALVCTFFEKGISKLATVAYQTGELEIIDTPFTKTDQVRASGNRAVFIAGSPVSAEAIVMLDLTTKCFEVVRRSADVAVESTFFARPETIEFPTEEGLTAHAYFYPPQNRDFNAAEDEKPPLIVKSHGGPTAAACATLELKIQFWTSRGFAVLDVNYGGSTGYGRAYRSRLDGKWGVVDVADCIKAAEYITGKGLADPDRVAIAGGSAGGYTTLCALTFSDFFKAGASYYGVSDLEALAKDTHKFESRYLERLVGPYPERRDIYLARSPIHHTDELSCPVILMQGMEDKIVPPNQAEMMQNALREKGLPVAYVTFEGEQHGFRKADSIKRSLEAELYFYSRIFGFEPADDLQPVTIENL